MCDLRFSMRQVDGVTILRLEGSVSAGEPVSELNLNLRSLTDEGRLRIVVDLTGVTVLDSSGLGTLAAVHAKLLKNQGHLKLVGPTGQVARLLEATGLGNVLETYATEQDAVGSFEKLRERMIEPLGWVPQLRADSSIL